MPVIKSNIAIFGLARSGLSLKNFLQKNTNAKIYLFDDNAKSLELLKEEKNVIICNPSEINWTSIDFLVISPGIDPKANHEVLIAAKSSNTKIISDIELFFHILREKNKTAKIIGITGTNGKSTTTKLLGHILENCNLRVEIGGNIGIPVFDLTLESDYYILEISSYHLDSIYETNFDIGILLNITPDHLDRYDFKIENYTKSKEHLFDISKKIIIGIDSEITKNIYKNHSDHRNFTTISTISNNADFFYKNIDNRNIICINNSKESLSFTTKLIGHHNFENIIAAFTACNLLNIKNEDIIEGIATFEGLNHRLQFIAQYKDIIFINDSKATTGDATISAINSFNLNDEIHLIVGGVAKSDGLTALTNHLNRIKKFYLIGKASKEFADFLTKHNCNFEYCFDLQNACKKSFENSLKTYYNDARKVILLSPACASFDQFKDFEERGEKFINYVKNLILKAEYGESL